MSARTRRAVAGAEAGGFVTPQSLATVRVPVEIRRGGADTVNPYDVDTRP
ncbi:hypothetical protein ACFYXS_32995 [Streptomyces sp. NPDC002574]